MALDGAVAVLEEESALELNADESRPVKMHEEMSLKLLPPKSPARSLSLDVPPPDTPVSRFRRKDGEGSPLSVGNHRLESIEDFLTFPENFEESLQNDAKTQLEATASWDVKIALEIEQARKAATILIEKTGSDDRMQEQLHEVLQKQIEVRRKSALAEARKPVNRKEPTRNKNSKLENERMLRLAISQDTDTSNSAEEEGIEASVVEEDHRDETEVMESLLSSLELNSNDKTESPHCNDSKEETADDISIISLSPREKIEAAQREELASPATALRSDQEEKKEHDDSARRSAVIKAQDFSGKAQQKWEGPNEVYRVLSATESDVGSVDGLPQHLRSGWLEDESRRELIMQHLDGVNSLAASQRDSTSSIATRSESEPNDCGGGDHSLTSLWSWSVRFLKGACGTIGQEDVEDDVKPRESKRRSWDHRGDDSYGLLTCADIIHPRNNKPSVVPSSIIRVTSQPPPPSYAETIQATEVDPRMQDWIENQWTSPARPPADGAYYLGRSRTVIVHEIVRGAWTWCTTWSPDGNRLAVATEKHKLAVVDTSSATVWRVEHDELLRGPALNHTTHSIRAIAWGSRFIAIGGTGNAVSILSDKKPYNVLEIIRETGFVGTLDWKPGTNVLAIGSRLNKAMIVRVHIVNHGSAKHGIELETELLHTSTYKNWVNCVAFSPGGACFAVGDAGGTVTVYRCVDLGTMEQIAKFSFSDAILAVTWSPDGKWLYAGGEEFHVNIVDTTFWEVVHKVDRERWVQCISCSNSGTHVAVGGVSSEVSILDVKRGWESTMGIQLKGLVPLSAKWSPKDRYLAVTGQDKSILIIETTNARHVQGHHLQSISPIVSIAFSPDGRTSVIGNENGVVTFFSLSGSTFETVYELVVALNDRLSIQWSLDGIFVAIGSKDALIVVGQKKFVMQKGDAPPKSFEYSVRKVLRDLGTINSVSIDPQSQYVSVGTSQGTWILDAAEDFKGVKEFMGAACLATSWSPDGRWLATIGKDKMLTIYDTLDDRPKRWRALFSLRFGEVGRSLAWGPLIIGGLLYLACGGEDNEITILEIRGHEGSWETVLRVPRDGAINALDWNTEGYLAAAIGNGTVSVVDLGYLQSGRPVNEMDYNWQRQALTCFTEIRRNRGRNSMRSVKWIPSAPGSDSLLAVGGTDGEVEILDLTERRRCRGYVRGL